MPPSSVVRFVGVIAAVDIAIAVVRPALVIYGVVVGIFFALALDIGGLASAWATSEGQMRFVYLKRIWRSRHASMVFRGIAAVLCVFSLLPVVLSLLSR